MCIRDRHYLTWRRFSPVRSLYLPIDLLEGAQGAQAVSYTHLDVYKRQPLTGVHGQPGVLRLFGMANWLLGRR